MNNEHLLLVVKQCQDHRKRIKTYATEGSSFITDGFYALDLDACPTVKKKALKLILEPEKTIERKAYDRITTGLQTKQAVDFNLVNGLFSYPQLIRFTSADGTAVHVQSRFVLLFFQYFPTHPLTFHITEPHGVMLVQVGDVVVGAVMGVKVE